MRYKKIIAMVIVSVMMMTFLNPVYADLAGTQNIGVIYSYGGDHPDLYFQGGWYKRASNNRFSFYYTEADRNIMYCIEPGIARSTGANATRQDDSYIIDNLSNRFLNGRQINDFINLILYFGYNGSIDGCATALGDFSVPEHKIRADGAGLGTQAAKATQMLIWETVVGERDASFNHVDPDAGYSPVRSVATSDGDVGAAVDLYYDRLVTLVRSHRNIPSFLKGDISQASRFDINNGAVTLTNTNDGLTLTDWGFILVDQNGNEYEEQPVFNISGNTLSFSIPTALAGSEVYLKGTDHASSKAAVAWSSDGQWHAGSGTQDLVNYRTVAERTGYAGFITSASAEFIKSVNGPVDSLNGVRLELWKYYGTRNSGYRNSSDTLIGMRDISSGGKAVFTGLDEGVYGVAEYAPRRYYQTSDGHNIGYPRSTPDGWNYGGYDTASDSEIYYKTFEITSDDLGGVLRYSLQNSISSGSLNVTKTTPQGDGFDITGAAFELYFDVDSNERADGSDYLVSSGSVSADGSVSWDRTVDILPAGDYVIRESWVTESITAVDGTEIFIAAENTNGWIRETLSDGKTAYYHAFTLSPYDTMMLNVVNDELSGMFSLIKNVNTEGDASEILFELYRDETEVASGVAQTEGEVGVPCAVEWEYNGDTVNVIKLPQGEYELREMIPHTRYNYTSVSYSYEIPEGWSISDDGSYFYTTVVIGNDDQVVSEMSFANTRLEGSLTIDKVSENGVVSGIGFNVYYRGSGEVPASDKIRITTIRTGDDGEAATDKLPYGWYEVEEVVPEYTRAMWVGGSLPNGNKLIKIGEGSADMEITAINTVSSSIQVRKADSVTGEAVGGVAFDLYKDPDGDGIISDEEASDCVHSEDLDGDGVMTFRNVGVGHYILRESHTVDGYYLDTTDHVIVVDSAGLYEVEIEDIPYTCGITVYKTDEDDVNHYLPGAKFTVLNEDRSINPVEMIEVTGEDGKPYYVTSEELHFGTYILVETQSPIGFAMIPGQHEHVIEIDRRDTTAPDFEIENIELNIANRCRGDIHVTKYDNDYPDNLLSGAVFTVYKDVNENGKLESADTVIGTMAEEADGQYYMRDLPYGHYLVEETISPEDYIRSEEIWSVFINSNGNVFEVGDGEFEGVANTLTGSIHIYKVDFDHPQNCLSGAEFTVYDSEGNTVGVMVEEATGNYYLRNVPYGEYTVEETKAPDKYVRSEEVWTAVIEEPGEVVDIADGKADFDCITNKVMTGRLRVIKTSYDGRLEGFSFMVTGEDYEELFVTDANGIIIADDLRIGTYTIREVTDSISETYVIPADQEIEITYGNETVAEFFNAQKKTGTPSTGEALTSIFEMIGAACLLCGVALYIRYRAGIGKDRE